MSINSIDKNRFLDPASEILSGAVGTDIVRIPPDMGLCDDCLKELYAESDPRCQHPFISCAHCGPRFSIATGGRSDQGKAAKFASALSYAREDTSMAEYPMCGFCDVQYSDPEDRRFHAPAIACHACGPTRKWREQAPQEAAPDSADASDAPSPDEDTNAALQMILNRSAHLRSASEDSPSARHTSADDRRILDQAAQILADGGVIAFKTFSGYYLAADPFNDEAVSRLESILGGIDDDSVTLPVMFHDMHEVRYYLHTDEISEQLLASSARPVVLLEHRLNDPAFAKAANRRFPETDEGTPEPSFAFLRRSRRAAALLPSIAAQHLLLDRISPLIFADIAKAGGFSFSSDDEMLAWFEQEPAIGGILYHDVPIRTYLADSVMQINAGQPQMLLRAKGYAPLPVIADAPDATADGAADAAADGATGAAALPDIFAAGSKNDNTFVLGKGSAYYVSQPLGDLDSAAAQRAYRDTVASMEELLQITPAVTVCDMDPLSETTRFTKTYAVEHGLPLLQVQKDHAHIASVMAEHGLTGPVIGVSFGAPGHGTDGALWGGDVLLCEGAGCKRMSHLKYNNVHKGRLLLTEGTAEAVADESGCQQFTLNLADILEYAGPWMEGAEDFDSAADDPKARSCSMLQLMDTVSDLLDIKGSLEEAAVFAQNNPGEDPASDLALEFYNHLIDAIVGECVRIRKEYGTDQIALSGSCFTSKVLLEGALQKLRGLGFKTFINNVVSPDDSCVSLGQAYIAMQAYLAMMSGR